MKRTKIKFKNLLAYLFNSGLVAQSVRRSPPTAGVPSSRLGHSMWVSWWMKRDLGRFSWGLSPFSPATNFIPLCLHTHLIHFVLFHFIRTSDGASGVGGLAFLLFTDLQTKGLHRMSSLAPALCRTRVEDILGQGFQPFEFECQFISFI